MAGGPPERTVEDALGGMIIDTEGKILQSSGELLNDHNFAREVLRMVKIRNASLTEEAQASSKAASLRHQGPVVGTSVASTTLPCRQSRLQSDLPPRRGRKTRKSERNTIKDFNSEPCLDKLDRILVYSECDNYTYIVSNLQGRIRISKRKNNDSISVWRRMLGPNSHFRSISDAICAWFRRSVQNGQRIPPPLQSRSSNTLPFSGENEVTTSTDSRSTTSTTVDLCESIALSKSNLSAENTGQFTTQENPVSGSSKYPPVFASSKNPVSASSKNPVSASSKNPVSVSLKNPVSATPENPISVPQVYLVSGSSNHGVFTFKNHSVFASPQSTISEFSESEP